LPLPSGMSRDPRDHFAYGAERAPIAVSERHPVGLKLGSSFPLVVARSLRGR
jgi:hypothetical protein